MIDEFEAHFEAMQMDALQQMDCTVAADGSSAAGGGSSSSDALAADCNGVDASGADVTCCICMEAPRNASVVHGETAHICCCLECARTLKAKGHTCPICNDPIDAVVRNYFA
uniref:RING-type domain-containing protein n=2 Tax=Prymnesium polylepis TaxID=72548 RepID=A0A6V4PQT7_9EUKA|mmetsp:Transcript_7024/g.16599  ORF Transcript_7024/g.16599 Transcript_7024/m.16599 type:complete len:112 (+) Transcript_7024:510-845(+)